MSESRANLEQILELLLAEENEQAEELLHEYVVAKARQQYERVLDESEEVEEDLDESEEVDESSCGSKKEAHGRGRSRRDYRSLRPFSRLC